MREEVTQNTTATPATATIAPAVTRGRPTILSLEKRCMIAGAFAHGLGLADAARLASVAPYVLRRCLERGRQETGGVFAELAALVDLVRALHQPQPHDGGDPEVTNASATSLDNEQASE